MRFLNNFQSNKVLNLKLLTNQNNYKEIKAITFIYHSTYYKIFTLQGSN